MRNLLFFLPLLTLATTALANDPPPLYSTLGEHGRTITTSSETAQRYFDQGLRLAYAFGRPPAAESFREAQRHDPGCAMCYWGEAWVLGPYINDGMREENAPKAYQAAGKALELAATASPVERALIEAMAVRYRAEPDVEDREELDRAYAAAMEDVVRRFPSDLDAGALYGEALLIPRAWNPYNEEGEPYPETSAAVKVLESVLGRDLQHPGACHLYIHAVEASSDPGRSEACADLLADAIPGASHVQHMPSHTYMRIGRYGDAVRANQRAVIADQMARANQAVAIYPVHNQQMLVYAGAMDGQSAVAIGAARDLAASRPSGSFQLVQILVRFGRWDELLELAEPSDAFFRGNWRFARGMAHLRKGDREAAAEELEATRTILESTDPEKGYGFFNHPQVHLLGIAAGILEGELAAADERWDDARAAFERAAELEDGLHYDEPEPWILPVRHYLGAMLLDAGRAAEAERVYRAELERHPANGWSLRGLELSLAAQGRGEEAAEAAARAGQAWERADVWLSSSRY